MTEEQSETIAHNQICQLMEAEFDCITQSPVNDKEAILLKNQAQLPDFMRVLKEKHGFAVLLLINAVEYKNGFQLIYQLQKMPPAYSMLIIKVNLSDKEKPAIPSVTELWASANWYERELWDLQGIEFTGHPNLKRILNPDSWEGFPLRKNYIPPLDALNGPITAVKGQAIGKLEQSVRTDVEIIEELPEQVNS